MQVLAGSSPYPWPYDGPVDAARIALVVAGTDPGWRAVAPDTALVGQRIAAVAAALAEAGGTVVALVQPVPARSARSEPPPGPGATPDGATVIAAPGLDGCFASPLEPYLRRRGIDHVLLAGYGLEAPVHSTMRGLNDRGYECLLVVDACTVIEAACRAGAISSIEMSGGIFGAVAHSTDVLAALAAPR